MRVPKWPTGSAPRTSKNCGGLPVRAFGLENSAVLPYTAHFLVVFTFLTRIVPEEKKIYGKGSVELDEPDTPFSRATGVSLSSRVALAVSPAICTVRVKKSFPPTARFYAKARLTLVNFCFCYLGGNAFLVTV